MVISDKSRAISLHKYCYFISKWKQSMKQVVAEQCLKTERSLTIFSCRNHNRWCMKMNRFTRFHSNIEFPSKSRGNNNQLLVPITLVGSAAVLLVLLLGAKQICTNTPSHSLLTHGYVNKKIKLLKLLVSSKTSDHTRQNWSYLSACWLIPNRNGLRGILTCRW